jgi:hypothetical protein
MALPRIDTAEDVIGFRWLTPEGRPVRLDELLDLPDAEPIRWLPTHLEALDDVLIDVAGRFGEIIGGGRRPTPAQIGDITTAYRVIDRLCYEYAQAQRRSPLRADQRSGQIIGTAVLMSVLLRSSLDIIGPAPFDGQLDTAADGMIGGHCRFHWVSESERWRGGRWILETTGGQRLPAGLTMLLFDSSGVEKDGALKEHRDALRTVTAAMDDPDAEPMTASGAIDWLLYDWLFAHRDGPDSLAVEIKSGLPTDAKMIVEAAGASALVRSRFDIGLLDVAA